MIGGWIGSRMVRHTRWRMFWAVSLRLVTWVCSWRYTYVSFLNFVWVKHGVSEAGTAFPQVKHEKSETHSAQSTMMELIPEQKTWCIQGTRDSRQAQQFHNFFILPDDRRRTNSQNLFSSNKIQMMEELKHTCHLYKWEGLICVLVCGSVFRFVWFRLQTY